MARQGVPIDATYKNVAAAEVVPPDEEARRIFVLGRRAVVYHEALESGDAVRYRGAVTALLQAASAYARGVRGK